MNKNRNSDFLQIRQYSMFDVHFLVNTSYETTPKWHGFLMTKLAATMAWIKQRTAEYQSVEPLELRLTNDDFRLTNGGCRFALLF
jgi:hypothetical protein